MTFTLAYVTVVIDMNTHYAKIIGSNFMYYIDFLDIIALSILFYAAFRDVLVRRVPNIVSLIILALGLNIHYLEGDLFGGLMCFLIILISSALLWRLGFVGGADAKLVSTTSLLFGHGQVAVFLMVTTLCGGLLGLLYLWMSKHIVDRRASFRPHGLLQRGFEAERWRIARKPSLPYAVAIASSAAVTFFVWTAP